MSREFAARIASSFADGVVLAELASAVSVQAAVDAALGEALEDSADLLIILDNCEHLVTAAAEVAARILTACRSRSSSRRPGATCCRLARSWSGSLPCCRSHTAGNARCAPPSTGVTTCCGTAASAARAARGVHRRKLDLSSRYEIVAWVLSLSG